jgi:hypothetical protein
VDKIKIAKQVVSTIVGIGVSKIVSGIIENNVDTTTIASKVTVASASGVLGWAAADATSDYTDRKIDEITAWWTENVTNRSN